MISSGTWSDTPAELLSISLLSFRANNKQLSPGKGIKTASLVLSANLCHYQYGALSLTSNAGNTAQKYTRPTAPELMSLAPAIMITYTAERRACQQCLAGLSVRAERPGRGT